MRRILLLLLIPVFLACGDDTTAPSIPSVAGSWTYNASNLSAGGISISCSVSGTSLVFTQSDGTFTGSYSGGTISCFGETGNPTVPVGSGTVANGSVTSAGAVSFDFDTQDWQNTGTLSDNSISGTATVRIDLGSPTGVVTVSGNFSAAR